MSSSNYPRLLDNDANLFRPVAATAATPALFIGHTDAIEAIQPAVGTCDDGTAYAVPGTFNRGLMDHTGLPTTSGPNGRYPWLPRAANSLYGTDGAVGGGWTVPSGLVPTFATPRGFMKVPIPADGTTRSMVCALAGVAPFHAMLRFKVMSSSKGSGRILAGFSVLGNTSDLNGFVLDPSYWSARVAGSNVGDAVGATALITTGEWTGAWLVQTGTTLSVYMSTDMYCWALMYSGAAVLAATKFVLALNEAADTPNQAATAWVDYVAFGNAQPQGQ